MEVDNLQPCSSKEPDDDDLNFNNLFSSTCDDTKLIGPVQLPSMEVQPFIPQDVPSTDSQPGVCGLYNLGNTCYMNSTLQCLLHDEDLKERFSCNFKRSKEEGLIQEFADLCSKYWSGQWTLIVPRKFKKAIGMAHTQFDGCGQHDGQEFLALFLASLHQELKCEKESSANNAGSVISSPEEKNSKRKRAGSNVDNNTPNNKRIDSSTINNHYLTLTSFIGKEKKTANVNVLNTDTECDEEITTDHSNKYPQTASRLNSDVFDSDIQMNNQPRQRHKSSEGARFVDQIKDLKLRQLKEPNCKQTNVIADIKRHGLDEKSHLLGGDSEGELKLLNDPGLVKAVVRQNEDISVFNAIVLDSSVQDLVLSGKFSDIVSKKIDAESSQLLHFEKDLSDAKTLFENLNSDPFIPKKIFSLNQDDCGSIPLAKKAFVEGKVEKILTCSNDTFSCLSQGDASGQPQAVEDKDMPDDKLNNELVEERGACLNQMSPELTNINEDPQDHASNIRGDICGGSFDTSASVADKMWLEYTSQNKSILYDQHQFYIEGKRAYNSTLYYVPFKTPFLVVVIVDTLQGQLESTVVCCKCSHKSTIYEPFMYLSVPIPHALQRSFTIRLVPLDGAPTQHFIFAPKVGRVQDLRDALAAKLKEDNADVDLSAFCFCEVKDRSILKVLDHSTILKSVNTTTRELQAIEYLNEVSEEKMNQDEGKTSWNSCCICLEDLSDPELLRHETEACSILMCQTCLQTSTQHYGVDNFTCPMCHVKCSPATDFVQLASSNQNRDVVISLSFVSQDKDGGDSEFVAPARVLRTSTTLPCNRLHDYVRQLIPASLLEVSNYQLTFTTLDGATCSRCDVTSMCTSCFVVSQGDDDVTLQPGDNLCVRFPHKLEVEQTMQENASNGQEAEASVTLEMCLNSFTKNEILDSRNPWYCPSCECHQIAEKRLRICRWPSTLIVYIKRFLYHSKTAVKVDDEVIFPVEGFRPGPISGTEAIHSKFYDLNSCVSHYGGVYSGHYTSCCKHPVTGKWHLYNDENVSAHEPSSKDAAAVYILFYKERELNVTKNHLGS